MKELAMEYKESISILSRKVAELERIKRFLSKRTKNPEQDPEIIDIQNRVRPLNNMLTDLKEVTKEVEHYYDKGWWRSEKYTFNAKKSRKFVYCEPIYNDTND